MAGECEMEQQPCEMEGPVGLTCVEEIDERIAFVEFKLWTETETLEDGMQKLLS